MQQVDRRMEEAIVADRQQESKRLADAMPPRPSRRGPVATTIAFPGLAAQTFHSPQIVHTRKVATEPFSARSRYTTTCSTSFMTLIEAILGRFTGDYETTLGRSTDQYPTMGFL